MTLEKRCTVEPGDFLALVYECGKCGTASRVPLSGPDISNSSAELLSRKCWQCGEPTGFAKGTGEHDALHSFTDGLRQLAKVTQGRNLRLKMELRCPDPEVKV